MITIGALSQNEFLTAPVVPGARLGRRGSGPAAREKTSTTARVGTVPRSRGAKGVKVMGTRLYVGNLPFDVDESQLRALFQEDGREVTEVKMITDRETGRPRGFAFVEMGSQEHAQAAISALNGREVGGRALTVNEAREQAPRGGGFGGGRGGRSRY